MLTETEYLLCSFHKVFFLAKAIYILTTLRISSKWIVRGICKIFKVILKKKVANNIEIR
jgi:hypothetical protein